MRLIIAHILLLVRGCQHPKTEGRVEFIDDGDDTYVVFIDTCTVCGAESTGE